nr:gluconolactonase [uncultured bacterium]
MTSADYPQPGRRVSIELQKMRSFRMRRPQNWDHDQGEAAAWQQRKSTRKSGFACGRTRRSPAENSGVGGVTSNFPTRPQAGEPNGGGTLPLRSHTGFSHRGRRRRVRRYFAAHRESSPRLVSHRGKQPPPPLRNDAIRPPQCTDNRADRPSALAAARPNRAGSDCHPQAPEDP